MSDADPGMFEIPGTRLREMRDEIESLRAERDLARNLQFREAERVGILEREREDYREKRANEVENLRRERDADRALLAAIGPHRGDGTVYCGHCQEVTGNDGIVVALTEALRDRDALAARVERIEGALREVLDYTAQIERLVYRVDEWVIDHETVSRAKDALREGEGTHE